MVCGGVRREEGKSGGLRGLARLQIALFELQTARLARVDALQPWPTLAATRTPLLSFRSAAIARRLDLRATAVVS